ncbi:hypothetical protein EJ04DRAFT_576098 [Polyplosphaeria fusca]|uniref:Zn(2)-C6 fungal-type domain-containing protein n=1 Tax=Polyplosphaeria fusca TaxID=682080 RepID=A0A9P4V2C0_9PLEO|nr:hypothetical protein EJ04DRAFT_576098 [Polyplosphaeria fusca]
MVNVAGKSKGCGTCKKRRIKCDERKPSCQRCEKSGYVCAGYEKRIHFINKSTAKFQDAQDEPSSTILINNAPVKVVPRMRTVAVPQELSLAAFRNDVCISFLMHNFVWRTYGKGWLEPAAGKLDDLSNQSIRALSALFFGISHKQEDIQMVGALRYGKALGLLRPALSDPRKPGVEKLIIPILLMLMHASYEEDTGAAVAHVKGLMMLLQVAGPYKFQHQPLRSAFESARSTLVTTFCIARQPLFLQAEEWKAIPWVLDPASKSQQNYLVDILVDIPGFLHDDAKLMEHDDPEARDSLLSRVKGNLYALHHWRFTWELLNPSAVYETMPPPAEAQRRVIPRKLNFRSHTQAAEIILYNATHMCLLALLIRLEDPSAVTETILTTAATAAFDSGFPPETPRTTLQLPDDVRTPHEPAIEICRAFEYQVSEAGRIQESNLFFLFPLGLAWPVLEDEKEYQEWIKEMLSTSPITSGYAVGRNQWFGKYFMPKVMARRGRAADAVF